MADQAKETVLLQLEDPIESVDKECDWDIIDQDDLNFKHRQIETAWRAYQLSWKAFVNTLEADDHLQKDIAHKEVKMEYNTIIKICQKISNDKVMKKKEDNILKTVKDS